MKTKPAYHKKPFYQFWILKSILLCSVCISINFSTVSGQEILGFGQSYFDSLQVNLELCGDLDEFLNEQQQEYSNFKNGISSRLTSRGSWEPSALFECGSFTVYYNDFIGEFSGGGFADPILGEARRNTFCEVLNYLESVIDIHPNANPFYRSS